MATKQGKKKQIDLEMIVCFDAGTGTNIIGISLRAHANGFNTLSEILSAPNLHEVECRLFVPEKSAAPYAGYCRTLRIVWNIGPVRISKKQDELLFIGSAYNLGTLAHMMAWFALSIDPPAHAFVHRHIEHVGGNLYLDPTALPLVLDYSDPDDFPTAESV